MPTFARAWVMRETGSSVRSKKDMGKIILVTGGAASGKSAYAEARIRELFALSELPEKRLLYLATMQRDGSAETDSRIAKHRRQRQGRGFETMEKSCRLEALEMMNENKAAEKSRCFILLEDLGNLLANEMYLPGGRLSGFDRNEPAGEALRRYILAPLQSLAAQAEILLIVSNEIFSDGGDYAPETLRYIHALGKLHQWLAAEATEVTEVVCGLPLQKKREKDLIVEEGEREELCWRL